MNTQETDVLVLGLGGMGSAALYHLARAGVDAVGIEQFPVGHDRGSSHGHSRAFRTIYEDPVYTRLAEAAIPFWRELESDSGETLLFQKGMVTWANEGSPKLQERVAVMDDVGSPYELLTPSDVRSRFPALRPPDGTVACFVPRSGFLDAGLCVRTHVAEARKRGATLFDETKVSGIDLDGDRPEVITPETRFRCDRLIVSAGPWAAHVLSDLNLPLRVTRQQKFYFRPGNSADFGPDRLPVYTDHETEFYGFPNYGGGIKVADDGLGGETTADTVDRTLDGTTRDRLRQWLDEIMPGNDAEFVSGTTCMYTMTPDRDFLIGPHPGNPNVLVAAGFSGHGFKFSTLVGKILTDLATTGHTDYPIERFRVDRFETLSSEGTDP